MSLGVLRPSRRARSVNTRITLATTKKHQLSVSDYYAKMLDYYAKMSQLADDLAALGTPLRDDVFVAYVLAGLDEEYNPVFTTVVAQVDPISPSDLYTQLLSFEEHTTLHVAASSGGSSSAMAAFFELYVVVPGPWPFSTWRQLLQRQVRL
jgi:hypothetical protein